MLPEAERNSLAAAAIGRVCVLGASGLLGRALSASLERAGVQVTRYARTPRPGFAHWDPGASAIDREPLAQADVVVNLAGENIAEGRWTQARKRALRDSRVGTTELLARTLAELPSPPRVLINASAVGYYGHRGDEAVYEDSPPGEGFLPELCVAWEAATRPAAAAGVRVVLARLAPVLTTEGGPLQKLLPLFRLGMGGRIGSGRQHMPWIAMTDAISVLRFAMTAGAVSGPLNVVAPESTTNEAFTQSLARVARRPALVAVPAIALKVALGELAQVLLQGADVRPRVLEQTGFRFDLPRLDDALDALVAG